MRASIQTDGKTLEISDRDGEVSLVMSRHGPRIMFRVKDPRQAECIAAMINMPNICDKVADFLARENLFASGGAVAKVSEIQSVQESITKGLSRHAIWMEHHKGRMGKNTAVIGLSAHHGMRIRDGQEFLNGKEPPRGHVDTPPTFEQRMASNINDYITRDRGLKAAATILSGDEIRDGYSAGTIAHDKAIALLRRDHEMTFNDADAYLEGDDSVLTPMDNAEYDASMANNASFEAEAETAAGELDAAPVTDAGRFGPGFARDGYIAPVKVETIKAPRPAPTDVEDADREQVEAIERKRKARDAFDGAF